MQLILFYSFAALAVLLALGVIIARHPVRAALSLVFAFIAICPLWLMAEAEFLALVIVFVYVGAVMTLLLFVLMMLNLEQAPRREGFVKYWPLKVTVFAALLGLLAYMINRTHGLASHAPIQHAADYSNTHALGLVLYTQHALAFEMAAVILLIAIVSAIALAFRGPVKRKLQSPAEQVKVRAADRVTIVKMPVEKE